MSTFITHPNALLLAAAASYNKGGETQKRLSRRDEEEANRRLGVMLFGHKARTEPSLSPETNADFLA